MEATETIAAGRAAKSCYALVSQRFYPAISGINKDLTLLSRHLTSHALARRTRRRGIAQRTAARPLSNCKNTRGRKKISFNSICSCYGVSAVKSNNEAPSTECTRCSSSTAADLTGLTGACRGPHARGRSCARSEAALGTPSGVQAAAAGGGGGDPGGSRRPAHPSHRCVSLSSALSPRRVCESYAKGRAGPTLASSPPSHFGFASAHAAPQAAANLSPSKSPHCTATKSRCASRRCWPWPRTRCVGEAGSWGEFRGQRVSQRRSHCRGPHD